MSKWPPPKPLEVTSSSKPGESAGPGEYKLVDPRKYKPGVFTDNRITASMKAKQPRWGKEKPKQRVGPGIYKTVRLNKIPNNATASIRSAKPLGTVEAELPTMARGDMASVGPGTYDPRLAEPLQTIFYKGEKDRFFRTGFMARTEAQNNPNLAPACYDPDCYWKYQLRCKWQQGERTGSLTAVPDADTGKYPLSIAEREKRRLLSNREQLDLSTGIPNWNRGARLALGSVHTPRNSRPLMHSWNTTLQTWDYMPQGCGHNTVKYGYLGLSRAAGPGGAPSQMERNCPFGVPGAPSDTTSPPQPERGRRGSLPVGGPIASPQEAVRPHTVDAGAVRGMFKMELVTAAEERDATKSETPPVGELLNSPPKGKFKPYKMGTGFGGRKEKTAPWSYFGSEMLNRPEPYHWEVEDYENAVKYRRENMQQWWRPEQVMKEQSQKFGRARDARNEPSQVESPEPGDMPHGNEDDFIDD